MQTLKLEGEKYDIRVNALSPVAGTRMTEDLLPADALAVLKPEAVTPAVIFLSSQDAPTGSIVCAGAGVFSAVKIMESQGVHLGLDASAEAIENHWAAITSERDLTAPKQGAEQTFKVLGLATGKDLG
jgi:hypothetical protein